MGGWGCHVHSKKEEVEAQNDAAACPGTEIIGQTAEAALEPTST